MRLYFIGEVVSEMKNLLCFLCCRLVSIGIAIYAAVAIGGGIPEPPLVLVGVVADESGELVGAGNLSFSLVGQGVNASELPVLTEVSSREEGLSFSVIVSLENSFGGLLDVTEGALDIGGSIESIEISNAELNGVPVSVDQGSPISVGKELRGAIRDLVFSTGRVDCLDPEEFDCDLDGLPDWWERLLFGTLDRLDGEDEDEDGVSDISEFRGGSDPLDSASIPMTRIELIDDRLVLSWTALNGSSYTISRQTGELVGDLDAFEVDQVVSAEFGDNSLFGVMSFFLGRPIEIPGSTFSSFYIISEPTPPSE